MNRATAAQSLLLIVTLALLAGCAGGSGSNSPAPLDAKNINLIFVVSPDVAYQAPGDINPDTANLTNQGLQRSLMMATYLKQQVLGAKNVTDIYTLEPMTHLQTTNNYPDMAAIGYIQQFAVLNQITLTGSGGAGSTLYTANSYPINASYAKGAVPDSAATPLVYGAQGLDFNDANSNNESLVTGIINANVPGFYVFSAPWETIGALMANVNKQLGYNLNLPTTYTGPNHVYAVSITPSGGASLVAYDSNLNPPSTYPVLPSPGVTKASCPGPATNPALFSIATEGMEGAVIPTSASIKRTIYLVRHAEAHPVSAWDDGNFLGAGQWRALALTNALTNALLGRSKPTQVYSIDPAQVFPGALITTGNPSFSYVRPSLTVEPYAIANNLPYNLVSNIEIFNPALVDPTNPESASVEIQQTSDFFFRDSRFYNQTVLVAWEHAHYQPLITALLASYFPNGGAPPVPVWPDTDYDTIWTVTIDDMGNLTVDNALCEGIDSAKLPVMAPLF